MVSLPLSTSTTTTSNLGVGPGQGGQLEITGPWVIVLYGSPRQVIPTLRNQLHFSFLSSSPK